MSIGAYTLSWRALAASAATAAIFLSVAAAAWGETPQQTWTVDKVMQHAQPGEFVNSMQISPDGKTLAVSFCYAPQGSVGKARIVMIDTTTGTVKQTLAVPEGAKGCVGSLQFSPDGTKLYGGGDLGAKIFIWDPVTGKYVGEILAGERGGTGSIDLNPVVEGGVTPGKDSRSTSQATPTVPAIALDGPNGRIELRDGNNQPVPGSPIQAPVGRGTSPVKDLEFSENGSSIAVVGGPLGPNKDVACLITWDDRQQKWVCGQPTKLPSKAVDVDTSPTNPKEFAVGCVYGEIVIIDGNKKEVIKNPGEEAMCVEYLPKGNLVSGGSGGTIIIRDGKTKQEIARIPVSGQVQGIVTSPDGNTIYVADSNGNISIIRPATPPPTPNATTPGTTTPNTSTPTQPAPTSPTPTPTPVPTPTPTPTPTPDPMGPNATVVNAWPYPQP